MGIHKSKGYAILNTLMEYGLVLRDRSTKAYSLGPGLLVLSRSVLDHSDLRRGVEPFLERLSGETGCTALLGLVNAGHVVVAAKHEPETGVAVTIRVGHRYPLTWGAHGKAIVAAMDEGERAKILDGGDLYFRGSPPQRAVDRDTFEAEFAACREKGYATDLGIVQAGVNVVSAAVLGTGGRPIGAVMAVGTFPPSGVAEVGPKVGRVARELSSLLGPTLESLYGVAT